MTDIVERITITGRVQGVFYRKWARATAEGLGLRGVVRNMADGSVEAVLAGAKDRLDAFAQACRAGPPEARVAEVLRASAESDAMPQTEGVEIAQDG